MTDKTPEELAARRKMRAAIKIASLLAIANAIERPQRLVGARSGPPGKTHEEPKTKAKRKMAAKSRKANRRHRSKPKNSRREQ